jgi:hypothetical protein
MVKVPIRTALPKMLRLAVTGNVPQFHALFGILMNIL